MLNSTILESENIRRNLQSLVLNHPLIYDCTAYHKLHIEMTWLLNSEWKCRQNKMYIKNSGYSGYSKLGWVHPLPSAAVTERFIITMPLLWNLSFSQLHREWSSRCNNNNTVSISYVLRRIILLTIHSHINLVSAIMLRKFKT